MVVHITSLLLTGFLIYTAVPGSSLFSWHPALMTAAFAFFMVQAILVFSPESSLIASKDRATKVTVHGILQFTALICALCGSACVYFNKERLGRPHFTSWHGTMGAVTICYFTVQVIGGINAKLYPSFIAKLITRAKLKMFHATSGLIVFLCGMVTVSLGMLSAWFTQKVQQGLQYSCLAVVAMLALSAMNQVTKAYVVKAK